MVGGIRTRMCLRGGALYPHCAASGSRDRSQRRESDDVHARGIHLKIRIRPSGTGVCSAGIARILRIMCRRYPRSVRCADSARTVGGGELFWQEMIDAYNRHFDVI